NELATFLSACGPFGGPIRHCLYALAPALAAFVRGIPWVGVHETHYSRAFMSLLRSAASAGLVHRSVILLSFVWGLVSTLQAATVTIPTADNEYRPGLLNQQYASWSAMSLTGGDRVQVGSGAGDANEVAAWDFSLPHGLNTVTGATLLIPLGTYLGSGA